MPGAELTDTSKLRSGWPYSAATIADGDGGRQPSEMERPATKAST